MSGKTQGEPRLWLPQSFVSSKFPAEFRAIKRNLFQDDYERIYPPAFAGNWDLK